MFIDPRHRKYVPVGSKGSGVISTKYCGHFEATTVRISCLLLVDVVGTKKSHHCHHIRRLTGSPPKNPIFKFHIN